MWGRRPSLGGVVTHPRLQFKFLTPEWAVKNEIQTNKFCNFISRPDAFLLHVYPLKTYIKAITTKFMNICSQYLKNLLLTDTGKVNRKVLFKGLHCFRLNVCVELCFVLSSIKCLAGQHPLAVKLEHPADDVA